jgi:hypothetical protein
LRPRDSQPICAQEEVVLCMRSHLCGQEALTEFRARYGKRPNAKRSDSIGAPSPHRAARFCVAAALTLIQNRVVVVVRFMAEGLPELPIKNWKMVGGRI